MPDIGWMELLVIGIVALIVVGPEDLPKMFQRLGQMVGKVRGMAKEFSNAMNAAADETGMSQMNKDLRAAAKFTNPKSMAKDMMGDVMDDIDPTKFEEGSATRVVAEKKLAAQKEMRAKLDAIKAAKAAETSAEPEEGGVDAAAGAAPAVSVEDPGPAQVEPATEPRSEPAADPAATPAAASTAEAERT